MDTENTQKEETVAKVTAEELAQRYNSDALRMADKLADALNDNYEYRSKLRALKSVQEELDKHKQLSSFVEGLGGTDAITAKIAEAESAAAQLKQIEQQSMLKELCQSQRLVEPLTSALLQGVELGRTEDGGFVIGEEKQPVEEFLRAKGQGVYESLQVPEGATPAKPESMPFPSQGIPPKPANHTEDLAAKFLEKKKEQQAR